MVRWRKIVGQGLSSAWRRLAPVTLQDSIWANSSGLMAYVGLQASSPLDPSTVERIGYSLAAARGSTWKSAGAGHRP
jgi:hypothetical protein